MGQYVDYYCKNEYFKLKPIVGKILSSEFPWMPVFNYDDIYSIAAQTVWNCEETYTEDHNAKFETYLISCLKRKFKTYVTHLNRDKRRQKDENGKPIENLSLDEMLYDGNTERIEKVMTETYKGDETLTEKRVGKFVNKLSNIQLRILILHLLGFDEDDIKDMINISKTIYKDAFKDMKRSEISGILKQRGGF